MHPKKAPINLTYALILYCFHKPFISAENTNSLQHQQMMLQAVLLMYEV